MTEGERQGKGWWEADLGQREEDIETGGERQGEGEREEREGESVNQWLDVSSFRTINQTFIYLRTWLAFAGRTGQCNSPPRGYK